ncbi:MAG: hypothetical protein MUP76_10290, partial [Acidimicrobiia bacterium]|nr:hypothetical protein [Acidimicrobiia bacterium]
MGAIVGEPGSSGGGVRRPSRRRLSSGRRLLLVVGLLISISLVSQTSWLQEPGPSWLEVVGDLIAPAWALAIIPIASRLRSAAGRGQVLTGSDSVLVTRLTQRRWAERSARAAQVGAVLIVLLAYTREWERFGERPGVAWFAAVIAVTLALLVLPSWWLRSEFHRRGVRYLDSGNLPLRLGRWLFGGSAERPARWAHVMAFAVVTMIAAFVILGQFDALLRGMHLPGDPPVGISGLPGIEEFDLSAKPGLIVERVGIWREYTASVGGEFGSAYSVVTTHALLDTAATIPAYLAAGIVLALVAWRRRLHF